jgi:hypothetical protein
MANMFDKAKKKSPHNVIFETKNFKVNDIGGYLYVSNYEYQIMKVSDWMEELNDEFISKFISKDEWLEQIEEIGTILDKYNIPNKKLVI